MIKRIVSPAIKEQSDTAHLLSEIDRLNISEFAKEEFRRMLRTMAGTRLHLSKRDLIKPGHVAMTQKLLDDGLTRADVQRALCVRVQVSRTKAYRLVRIALEARYADRQIGLFSETPSHAQ
jgi:hypothetical protein